MKKLGSLFLSAMVLITISATPLNTPVSAATRSVELANYDSHPQFAQLNEAYIEYSVQAEEMGKFVTLPLEYFVLEYQKFESLSAKELVNMDDSIDAYLAGCVSELRQNESLEDVRAKQADIQRMIQMELSTEDSISPQSAGGKWYYNCPELAKAGNYETYPELLGSDVISGDLVHDDNGLFGITGHSAIVMGHYYSNLYAEYYVRVCEAVKPYVCYGILSDDRVDERATSVYRVNGSATSTKRIAASNWVASQIGEPWSFTDVNYKTENISKSRTNWYCSLLVYAAYKAQAIDLGDEGGSGAIMPRELRDSANVSLTF